MRKTIWLGLAGWCLAGAAWAQTTPMGTWRTIDDATGKAKSIVEITPQPNGTLAATVVRVLDEKDPAPLCDKCRGDRKNKPVLGMQIAWNLRRDGEHWDNGEILDPANGKIYDVRMTPIDGGKRLEVRGYLGLALLGRTQVWVREP